MKLYEISDRYMAVLDAIADPETGEIIPEKATELEAISQDFQEKAISVSSFIRNLEADEVAIDAAMCSMQIRRDSIARRRKSLNDYLKVNMEKSGVTQIKCPWFQISMRKCPPSLEVLNERQIPDRYFNSKEAGIPEEDLLDAMKRGEVPVYDPSGRQIKVLEIDSLDDDLLGVFYE